MMINQHRTKEAELANAEIDHMSGNQFSSLFSLQKSLWKTNFIVMSVFAGSRKRWCQTWLVI